MTDANVMELGLRAMTVAMTIAAPVLGVAASAGVVMGLFQAVTQIQEISLAFIPKVVAVAVALALAGPWMLRTLVAFPTSLLSSLPGAVS
jgi:flagellar biosynthesis protein FliQ